MNQETYFKMLTDFRTIKGQPDSYYSNILKELIKPLVEYTDKCFDSIFYDTLKDTGSLFLELHDDYKKIFENIKKEINDTDIMTISKYNVFCMIYVILHTEFQVSVQEDVKIEFVMVNYPGVDIIREFYDFKWDIESTETIYNKMKKHSYFLSLLGRKEYSVVDHKFVSEFKEYTFDDLKNVRLFTYYGQFTTKTLVDSIIDEMFYIGIVTDMTWADGRYYTPFEFAHHDIIHASNRGYDGYNKKHEKHFLNYIETNNISDYEKEQIYLIFFLIVHESMIESMIDYSSSSLETFEFNSFAPQFICKKDYWTNRHFYGELIPLDIFKKGSVSIFSYIDESIETFKKHFFISKETYTE